MITLDPGLAEILACPACKSPVRLDGEELFCTRADCGLIYPIRDEIPVLLIDEARKPAADDAPAQEAAPAEPSRPAGSEAPAEGSDTGPGDTGPGDTGPGDTGPGEAETTDS